MALCLVVLSPDRRVCAATAADVGSAEIVVRDVEGRLDRTERQIAVEDQVFGDEVIRTKIDSATRLLFLDGTKLSIGPRSTVKLDRYVYDPGTGTGSLWLDMVQGVFRFASGSLPRDSIKLQTPFANLAVRGTVFGVDVASAVVFTQAGLVEVALHSGQVFLLERGQCLLGVRQGNPFVADGDACLAVLDRYAEMLVLLGALERWPDDLDGCTRYLFEDLRPWQRWKLDWRSYLYAVVWSGLEPPRPQVVGGFGSFAPFGCVGRDVADGGSGRGPGLAPPPAPGPPVPVPVPPVLTLLAGGVGALVLGLRIAGSRRRPTTDRRPPPANRHR